MFLTQKLIEIKNYPNNIMKYFVVGYFTLFTIPIVLDIVGNITYNIKEYIKQCKCSICQYRLSLGLTPIHN